MTTPAGLNRQIDVSREPAIWGTATLVVKRFDLKIILQSILESYADSYAANKAAESEWQTKQPGDDIG